MLWIGLTGGIASGKSSVAKILESKKIPIVYADSLAHEVYQKTNSVYQTIVQSMGKDSLNENGELDRKKVGEIVFKDQNKKQVLENIIHPYVKQRAEQERKKFEKQGFAMTVYEVPLLFEKNMDNHFDRVLLVTTDFEHQIERLKKRNNLDESAARLRIKSQMSNEDKIKRAQDHIENVGSPEELKNKVEFWLESIEGMYNLHKK